MSDIRASILIVDDEERIGASLAEIFMMVGHRARYASDGLAALIEMRQEIPDILLSDLNMPVMSGFELLSVVRRRFPAVRVIAMSGAFTGKQIPCGVSADAFYEKGIGVAALLNVIEDLTFANRQSREAPEPIWIQRNGHDTTGTEFVTIACPDCFRTFPQMINGTTGVILDTSCVFCKTLIHYGIIEPLVAAFPQRFQPALHLVNPDLRNTQRAS